MVSCPVEEGSEMHIPEEEEWFHATGFIFDFARIDRHGIMSCELFGRFLLCIERYQLSS